MRSPVLAMLITSMLLVTSGCVLAQKNTSNGLSSSTLAQLDGSNDACLARKITYDGGYKRLHAVANELTSISGVTVVAGKTVDDWQVRDIPLVVCVKDMPLGKLLQAIANATHCCCIPEIVSGDGGKTRYRIYRGPAEQAKIDAYLAQAREAKLTEAKWAWDAMAAFGKRNTSPGSDQRLWLISKLVSTLDAEAKSRLFGGEAILVRGADPARHELMAQLYRNVWSDVPQCVHLQNQPTEAEISSATLAIELRDTGYYRSIAIRVTIDPVIHGENVNSWTNEVNPYTLKKYYDSSFPRYPEQIETSIHKETVDIPGMLVLHSTADWDRPYLKSKFDLEMPADTKHPTFADLIRNVALASGCNIVAEDFMSNLDPSYAPVHAAFRRNTSAAEALRALTSLVNERGYTWFANDSDRLLLGWAHDGFVTHWQECHAGLLPEAYMNSLRSKYNSSGLDLDDFMRFTSMTSNVGSGAFNSADPYIMWVNHAAGLWRLYDPCIPGSGFWRIYDSLTPSDKLLAKSERGCPLGKLNADWVAKTLRMCRLGRTNDTMRYEPAFEETRAMMAALADPKVISTMVMYIKKSLAFRLNHHLTPADYDVDMSEEEAAKVLGLTDYEMLIRYTVDGKSYEAHTRKLWLAFPARSVEREAQMLKAAEKGKGRAE